MYEELPKDEGRKVINKLVELTLDSKIKWTPTPHHSPGQNSYSLEAVIAGTKYSFWGHPGKYKDQFGNTLDTPGIFKQRRPYVTVWIEDVARTWEVTYEVTGDPVVPLSDILQAQTEGVRLGVKDLAIARLMAQ